jgi:hypothetical protein
LRLDCHGGAFKRASKVARRWSRADIWVDGELQPKPEMPWSRLAR